MSYSTRAVAVNASAWSVNDRMCHAARSCARELHRSISRSDLEPTTTISGTRATRSARAAHVLVGDRGASHEWNKRVFPEREKRPCSICRRWFLPDVRVGEWQRACGTEECQRARHREAGRAWHARHRDNDRGRRWQVAVDAAKAGSPPSPPDRTSSRIRTSTDQIASSTFQANCPTLCR